MLRKLLPRKALRALEEPAREIAQGPVPDLARTLQGMFASANRAGLLVCGDPAVALTMVLTGGPGGRHVEGPQSQESVFRAMLGAGGPEGALELLGVGGVRLAARQGRADVAGAGRLEVTGGRHVPTGLCLNGTRTRDGPAPCR